ncbi:MAG: LPS biosynthesis protein [Deltaproteobacteria bacterium RBG_16_71_12]|nr:MAG: LPS biosynthesis protein [Deltaproteobacteria bacterium RBG_16_71_12]
MADDVVRTTDGLEVKYGLPPEVRYCRRCVISNQRPTSSVEFKHTRAQKHRPIHFDAEGICDACRFAERKEQIDWAARERELVQLLDEHRSKDGSYDCIVPGSGGKDSCMAAHVLKYKYGMHPLTITWPPILYTEIGLKNWRNWLEVGGFDNVTWKPSGRTMKTLTRLAIENLLHPFQTFILGQKNLAPKIALQQKVPLIFYGENEAEYGNPFADNASSLRDKSYFAMSNLDEIHLGGTPIRELVERYGVPMSEIRTFLPAPAEELERSSIEVRYLGYYLKWTPQEAYYYAVENCGFEANPERTEGTYSKYNSLDDKIDGYFYYTLHVKFGIGRATTDASQEIRNRHITREEGVALVRRFDGEFPARYFHDVMSYIGLDPDRFMELCDEFRSPHLWVKEAGAWKLRHPLE